MPFVDVYHQLPLGKTVTALRPLVLNLREVVAKGLQVGSPEHDVGPEVISTRFHEAGQLDWQSEAVQIVIDSNDYPIRIENTPGIKQRLEEALKPLIPMGLKCGVWLKWVRGEWLEFEGTGKAT